MKPIAALLVALAIAACSVPQPLAPDNVTVHTLAARPAPAASTPRDVVIEVAVPRAAPGFDTADMMYTRGAYAIDRFASNRWVDTPPRMLSPLLVRALDDTGSFRAVVEAPSAASADYRVDTEIVRLVQNFATTPSRSEIAVRVQVTNLRTRRVVATQLFEDAEPSAAENAAGGVAAANAALARILSRIARLCVEAT